MRMRYAPLTLLLIGSVAQAADKEPPKAACPAAISKVASKAFPDAKVNACKAEKKGDLDQFEVKLTRKDGSKVEVDVSPDGKILQIEEPIAIDKIPSPVMKAFAAKYPDAEADKADKQTRTDQGTFYEIAFRIDQAKKEATFREDGSFVEEE